MLGFLVAFIAGLLVPQIEDPLAGPVTKAMEGQIPVAPSEKRVVAVMLAMVIAAILAELLDSGSTFGVIFGVILGYFGMRIYAVLKRIIEARND